MTTRTLQRPALVLNRNWQPVNVATVARALVLLWNEAARVVDPDDFRLYTWADWARSGPGEGEAFIRAVRLRLRVPEVIVLAQYNRLPTARGELQPPQRLQAGPLDVPVLRPATGRRGVDDRPRRAAFARGHLDVGELRAGVHRLQQAQGRPHAGAGGHASSAAAGPPDVEAALRTPRACGWKSWSKFISEAYWNVPLESDFVSNEDPRTAVRGLTRVCSRESRRPPKPPRRGSTPLARALSHWTFAEKARQTPALSRLKSWFAHPVGGQSPFFGQGRPDGVTDRIGLSEGPGPGSTPGRDFKRY